MLKGILLRGGCLMEGYRVIVREKTLQQDMYYKNTNIMRYTIKYPKFISDTYQTMLAKLNSLYRTKAVMYERSNVMNLYQMAMVEYEYSVANNYPIRQFEAYVDFVVTYNQNCVISLYFDRFFNFTGFASPCKVSEISFRLSFHTSMKLIIAQPPSQ
jgi:hypothetical protein